MGNVKYVTGLNLVVTQLCAVGNRPKFHSFKDQFSSNILLRNYLFYLFNYNTFLVCTIIPSSIQKLNGKM